jgi:2'-deoxynucleoside 5'-phosphate N-hydrolase
MRLLEDWMNIYFSCSITGGRADEQVYQLLVAEMLANGHQVPTAHLSSSNIMELEKVVKPAEIFSRDMKWLENCDVVVAEVSTPSHGVGYEIATAISMGKPVFCLYRHGRRVSMILTGNPARNLTVASYNEPAEAVEQVITYLNKLQRDQIR